MINQLKSMLIKYFAEKTSLSDNEKSEIASAFKAVEICKNNFWVKQNEICSEIAFICEGIIRVFHETEEKEITLQFLFPNNFMASLSSLTYNIPSLWNFKALTDCKILLIDNKKHQELINKYPDILDFHKNPFMLSFADLESRLLSLLSLSAEQRFKKLFSEYPEIFNQVPLKHIASSLGITPETLSRLRKNINQ